MYEIIVLAHVHEYLVWARACRAAPSESATVSYRTPPISPISRGGSPPTGSSSPIRQRSSSGAVGSAAYRIESFRRKKFPGCFVSSTARSVCPPRTCLPAWLGPLRCLVRARARGRGRARARAKECYVVNGDGRLPT